MHNYTKSRNNVVYIAPISSSDNVNVPFSSLKNVDINFNPVSVNLAHLLSIFSAALCSCLIPT